MKILNEERTYLGERVAYYETEILRNPGDDQYKQAIQLLNNAIKGLNTLERSKANSRPKTSNDKLLAELKIKDGLKVADIAKLHDVSERTVYRACKLYKKGLA